MSKENVAVVESFYAAAGRGDVPSVMSLIAPEAEWWEAEGFIYAGGNPYVGPSAILGGVFLRLATEWEGFAARTQTFHDAGDTVIVTGRYAGTYRETGKPIDAQFAHIWTVADGRIVRFQQYTDTLQTVEVTRKAALA